MEPICRVEGVGPAKLKTIYNISYVTRHNNDVDDIVVLDVMILLCEYVLILSHGMQNCWVIVLAGS